MRGIRTFLHEHRVFAALVLSVLLSVRLLIPSGYMMAIDAKVLTVVVCTGVSGEHQTAQLVIPQDGQKSGQGNGHGSSKSDPCPYSALSMAATTGANITLLAAAFVFILALGFAPVVAPLRDHIPYLRPPLRGPPVVI